MQRFGKLGLFYRTTVFALLLSATAPPAPKQAHAQQKEGACFCPAIGRNKPCSARLTSGACPWGGATCSWEPATEPVSGTCRY